MLDKIYLVVNTSTLRNSGTKSEPVLILSNNNYDQLHHTFELAEGIREGTTEIMSVDVHNLNLPGYYGHVRLGIRGADAWLPDKVFVWGENNPQHGGGVVPIAVKMWAPDELSTDEDEGRLSMPLSRAYTGSFYTRLNRILLLIQNGSKRYSGTKSPVRLEMRTKNDTVVLEEVLPEGTLEDDGALFMQLRYIQSRFTFNELRSITLEIQGDDSWNPESLMLFGLDDRTDEREYFVPLAYVPDWEAAGLSKMSTDDREGVAKLDLYRAYL